MFFNFSTFQLFNSLALIALLSLPVYAFEDCVVSTNGKLSDIKIEQNDIIDVFPLYTIMNEKNTLIVHPLKEGKTRFCVLKNGKEIVVFNVGVTEENTVIDDVEGFDIFSVDIPPDFEPSAPLAGATHVENGSVDNSETTDLSCFSKSTSACNSQLSAPFAGEVSEQTKSGGQRGVVEQELPLDCPPIGGCN